MEVTVADMALESLPDAPPLGADRVEPRRQRGIVGSGQRATCYSICARVPPFTAWIRTVLMIWVMSAS